MAIHCIILLMLAFLGMVMTAPSSSPPLLTLLDDDVSNIKECNVLGIVSCKKVQIHFDNFFKSHTLSFPYGPDMTRDEEEWEQRHNQDTYSLAYRGGNWSMAFMTYSRAGGFDALAVSIKRHNISNAVVSNCGRDCHVIVRHHISKSRPAHYHYKDTTAAAAGVADPLPDLNIEEDNRQSGTVEIYATFYYTKAFSDVTSNIELFVQNQVDTVNTMFKNSGLTDMVLKSKCILPSTVIESSTSTSDQLINDLVASKSTFSALGNSADIAMLLVANLVSGNYCGRVYQIDPVRLPTPIPAGWVAKGCNAENMAHEIGHLLGARHNRVEDNTDAPNPVPYPYTDKYGHGYLVPGTNYYTIMSYAETGFNVQIPYYSSPNYGVNWTFPNKTVAVIPLGDAQNDVVRTIRARRTLLAAVGNQATACPLVVSTTTAKPITTTTTCIDQYADCKAWANAGLCSSTNNPATYVWTQQNCRRSCLLCSIG